MANLMEVLAFRTPVRLGVGETERSSPQDVEWTLRVRFPAESPRAVETDRIEDALCYASLCEALAAVAARRPYLLVEHLAREGYLAVRAEAERTGFSACAIEVTLHKLHPPVAGLRGGVRFVYGDRFE